MTNKIRKFTYMCQQVGLLASIKYSLHWLLGKSGSMGLQYLNQGKRDLIASYNYINTAPFGEEYRHSTSLPYTINWIIPDFQPGSGGHLNIFRLVFGLEQRGFTCRIILVGTSIYLNSKHAKNMIRKHFYPIDAEVFIGYENMPPAWATIATSWQTAYPLKSFRGTLHKLYFVQDLESMFYAQGAVSSFAEQTYSFGFKAIAAGNWLAEQLSTRYGLEVQTYGFSYDPRLYHKVKKEQSNKKKIFFYARPSTPRRGFELGLLVLSHVMKYRTDTSVLFAGGDLSSYKIDFPHMDLGMVPISDLADVYSMCDVALVLSFTNLSLLPLELMACGCPVVSNRGDNVEWFLDETNSVCVSPTTEELSNALTKVLDNDNYRNELIERAKAFAEGISWDTEVNNVSTYLHSLDSCHTETTAG